MTMEKEVLTGKVARVTPWSSGKGGFVSFEGNDEDYYYFGSSKYSEGEQCTVECAPGSGTFSDKIELKKKISGPDSGSEPALDPAKPKDDFESAAQDGLTVYLDKQNLIVAQCCMKIAGQVVGDLLVGSDEMVWEDIDKLIFERADAYFARIIQMQPGAKTNSKGK